MFFSTTRPTVFVSAATIVLALAALVSMTSSAADAASTFECERVWRNASAGNSLIACMTNVSHLATLFNTNEERSRIGGVLIPLAVVLIVVIIFPIFLALRYCVDFCGSSKRRPGYCCYGGEEWDHVDDKVKDRFYDPGDANCARGTAYVVLFLSFCPMILLLVGTGDVQEAYNKLFEEVFSIVGWAETKEKQIRGLVTSNGTFIGSINQTFLDDLRSAVAGYKQDLVNVNDINTALLDVIKTVSIVFALLPMLSITANACFAAFDVRTCWPLLNSLFHFVFLCLYAVIASGVLLLGVLTDRICGERDAFLDGSPSLGSYYLVPRCEKAVAFGPVKNALNEARGNTSYAACLKLQQHCRQDANSYQTGTPAEIFYCPTLTAPQTQCTKYSEVRAFYFDAAYVTMTAGGGPTCTKTPCNVSHCASTCSTQAAKDYAAETHLARTNARDIEAAYNVFNGEVGNCTALVHRAFSSIQSCRTIQSSVFFVGVGSSIFTGLFVIGLFVIFRGQKRFFKPAPVKGGDGTPGSRSPGALNLTPRSRSRSPGAKSLEPYA